MNIVSLLPPYVEDHYPKINGLDIGVLLSVYQFSYLITCPIMGEKMGSIGRKNTILCGSLILGLSTFFFGVAALFNDIGAFFTISMFARAF